MKIALFSDIHANLPALQAFFDSVEAQKPDAIGYDVEAAARAIEVSPLPDEFADMLRKAY